MTEDLLAPLGQRRVIRANGIDIEVYESGAGEKLALLLHGFPEHSVSWRAQAPMLAGMGYRVWVPNQRGYGGTTTPAERDAYAIDKLTGDIAALIDAFRSKSATADFAGGAKSVTLIAHDWGALLAWVFAARKIRPLDKLVILNVPHPLCFKREYETNPKQKKKSWYTRFFQLPLVPEMALSRKGGAPIAKLFRDTCVNKANFPRELLSVYAANAARPGGMRGMINWYRAAMPALFKATDLGAAIEVPTLVIWGEKDVALEVSTLDGTDQYVRDLKIVRLPNASHWVQQDAPDEVNAAMRAFLAD
ncbi:MAG: alpha/beta hydrolase [Hyphomicrobiales bacterium]|nr:alpha/beta hydrolase [Hyphomicrobiales bacterium]